MSTQETIESVREAFRTDSKLVAKDPDKYESLKIKFLGRKGLVAELFSNISNVATDLRPQYGKDLNKLKNEISSFFDNNKAQVLDAKIDSTDNSLPGPKFKIGNEHPIQKTLDEMLN